MIESGRLLQALDDKIGTELRSQNLKHKISTEIWSPDDFDYLQSNVIAESWPANRFKSKEDEVKECLSLVRDSKRRIIDRCLLISGSTAIHQHQKPLTLFDGFTDANEAAFGSFDASRFTQLNPSASTASKATTNQRPHQKPLTLFRWL